MHQHWRWTVNYFDLVWLASYQIEAWKQLERKPQLLFRNMMLLLIIAYLLYNYFLMLLKFHFSHLLSQTASAILPNIFSICFSINNEIHYHNTRASKNLHQIRFESNIHIYSIRIQGPFIYIYNMELFRTLNYIQKIIIILQKKQ